MFRNKKKLLRMKDLSAQPEGGLENINVLLAELDQQLAQRHRNLNKDEVLLMT